MHQAGTIHEQGRPAAFTSPSPTVVVIGGGLAGIAASVTLAKAGLSVTLVETRKHLGGRATSFIDPATGMVVDNCQHVLMGCCTNLRHLYGQLGVADRIRWHRRLYFAGFDRAGEPLIDTLEADDLPAPLHLTTSLMRFGLLSATEKAAIARGMVAMIRLGPGDRANWHDRSFAQWLAEHGQPRGAVDRFWSVVIISALNEQPQRVAADLAIQVFQEAFLSHEDAYVMGLPTVPLVQLYDAAEKVLQEAGGRLRLSTGAEAFDFGNGQVESLRVTGDRRVSADAFISAVPFDRLVKLCPTPLRTADVRLAKLDRFEVSPILGIHLWFAAEPDRPVMDLPHLILTDSPLQWIFNKGQQPAEACDWLLPRSTSRQKHFEDVHHLHGVISAAHDLVNLPGDRIQALALAEVRRFLPGAADAILIHAQVIKEKRATFSAGPGVDAIRPPTRGTVSNLYLAGDFCRSGWPATMEGAVRSGYQAAAAVLEDTQPEEVARQEPDLPPRGLYRALARRGSSH